MALKASAVLSAELNGVFLGPAVRASAPYAEVSEAQAGDWSTKDVRGREVRVGVVLRDAAEAPDRIGRLADACERAIEALPREMGGWQVAHVRFVRSRIAGDGPGRWIAAVDYRVRMLEE
jgi:murein endopeptidase